MKGRKPKPTNLKRLQGTYRPDRANSTEPQFEVPSRMPNVPRYLDEHAAEVWRDLGGGLLRAGLLTVVDKYALAMFCVPAGRYIHGNLMIEKTGGPVLTSDAGNLYQNPWLHVVNKAFDQMRQMLSEFGLSPAERARLHVAVADGEPSLADQLFVLVRDIEEGKGEEKEE